jgi:hypothetical protein
MRSTNKRPVPRRLMCGRLAALALLAVASGASAQDFTDGRPPQEWRVRRTTVKASGSTGERPAPLHGLSTGPVTAILGGPRGTEVVAVDFPGGVAAPGGSSAEAGAQAFLETHLAALAPSVPFSELRIRKMPYSCETAPSFEGKGGATVIFERVVDGRPVIGGSLAVRVEGDGTVVGVYNSLAPVEKHVLRPTDLNGRFRQVPALKSGRRVPFAQLVRDPRRRKAILLEAAPVLVPLRQGSAGGFLEARHAKWSGPGSELMSGFVLADGTVLGAAVVPATRRDKTVPLVHLDKRTKLPTFVSYRPRGGQAVSAVGVFGNPAEIAFRFLEENPEVFRSGAARCGFEVLDVTESPASPRITFVKMGQLIAGRRVFGGELVFEIEGGNRIQTIQGHTLGHGRFPLVPALGPEVARAAAEAQLAASLQGAPAPDRARAKDVPISTELAIFPGELVAAQGLLKPLRTRLAYHTRTLLHGLFVDAITGDVLYGYSRMPGVRIVRDAAGRTILEKPLFTEVSRDEVTTTPGTALSPDAAAAVPALAAVNGFYAAHGWNGRDGRGADWVTNVNVNLFGCPNAVAVPLDEETYFCTGMAVPDVVAHELTHTVVGNSSELVYADESGALNESYSDVMGNITFPDVAAPGAAPGWLLGEGSAAGPIRNMAAPATFVPAQPATYALYASRSDLGCSPFDLPGLFCDFGGVHTNSGITNLAHVLMSDGGAVAGLGGMGRQRVRMIAFDVLTRRLSRLSRLIDSALATRASCDTLLALGATDLTGAPFRQIDCDQIPGAFATVGLEPDLVSNWLPPVAAFAGIIPRMTGEVTNNACPVTDLILQQNTPAGQVESQALVVGPGAPLTTGYFGLETATIATTAPPIGTLGKGHVISWTSVFGQQPQIGSAVLAPPPAGAGNCAAGGLVRETRTSGVATSPGIPFVGGAGTLVTGNAASAMNPACTLVRADVEIVDGSGNSLAGPGTAPTWSEVVYIAFVPVTLTRTATITAQPPGLAGGAFNLSAPVAWSYSVGLADVKWRLVYLVGKPAGVTCTP